MTIYKKNMVIWQLRKKTLWYDTDKIINMHEYTFLILHSFQGLPKYDIWNLEL